MRVNKPQMQTATCVCVHGNVHSDQSHLAVHLSMLLEDMAAFCFFFLHFKNHDSGGAGSTYRVGQRKDTTDSNLHFG